jgi:predicted transcriptional regulator
MANYTDIGALQMRVMNILWERGSGTVHEVLEAFPPDDRPAYTTILQVLRTLERRAMVAHVKEERQHRYRPVVAPDAVEAGVVHTLLDRVFAGSAHRLVARLLEATPLDPEELEEIRRLVDQREAELESSNGRP